MKKLLLAVAVFLLPLPLFADSSARYFIYYRNATPSLTETLADVTPLNGAIYTGTIGKALPMGETLYGMLEPQSANDLPALEITLTGDMPCKFSIDANVMQWVIDNYFPCGANAGGPNILVQPTGENTLSVVYLAKGVH